MRILLLFAILAVTYCAPNSKSSRAGGTPKTSPAQEVEKQRYETELVAGGLEVPWSIAFAPDGRIFVTERPGRLRVIERGALREEPVHVFTEVESESEEGLMGLALHPDFATNHLLYVSYAARSGKKAIEVRIVRFRETGNRLVEPRILIAGIPAAQYHAGCRLAFGPDRKLYITTGDATDRDLAQRMNSLAGKILRINDDGSVPADNPFPGSPVWTLGHRNPQGIDWHPESKLLYSTEHGPSGFDGPGGGDEVNLIQRGKNYGWPLVHHRDAKAGLESPVAEYTPAVAPASGAFYRGTIAELKNNFFFGCLRGRHLHRISFDATSPGKIIAEERLFTNLGRIREVAMGPDGNLYFATSNRDGRGSPAREDDRIFRMVAR